MRSARQAAARRAGLHFFLHATVLLTFAAPPAVQAQSDLRFSVVPGDDSGLSGIGTTETDFVFSVAAANALCYQVDFGNNESTGRLAPEGDGRAVFEHRYARARRYQAVLRVWWPRADEENLAVDCAASVAGFADPIVLTLGVVVRAPSVAPPPPQPVAIFSAAPSRASDLINDAIAPTWADFTFSAYVVGATRYQLDYGDGIVERNLTEGPAGEGVVRHHRYTNPDTYTAVLTASRASGGDVILRRQITAVAPAAKDAVQWPLSRSSTSVIAEDTDSSLLPWLLLFAAVLASLRLHGGTPAQSSAISFGGTRDPGRATVQSGDTVRDAVSLRVRTGQATFKISDNAVARQVKPATKTVDPQA